MIDEHTLGFADYRGNRQYITLANLSENDRAYLFLLDPARRQRIKLWGRARVVEDDPALVERLFDKGYKASAGTRHSLHHSSLGRELLATHRHALYRSRYRRRARCRADQDRRAGSGKRRLARTTGGAYKHAGMNHDSYPDSYIRGILNTVKTIAMVGFSPNTARPSYFAFKYLIERGFKVIPINPGHAGKEFLGQVCARLAQRGDAGADRHGRHLPRAAIRYADRRGGAQADAEAAGDLDAAHHPQ